MSEQPRPEAEQHSTEKARRALRAIDDHADMIFGRVLLAYCDRLADPDPRADPLEVIVAELDRDVSWLLWKGAPRETTIRGEPSERLQRIMREWEEDHRDVVPPNTRYPNIEAMAAGTVAGEFREWPLIRPEAQALLKELDTLRDAIHGPEPDLVTDAVAALNSGQSCDPKALAGLLQHIARALKASFSYNGFLVDAEAKAVTDRTAMRRERDELKEVVERVREERASAASVDKAYDDAIAACTTIAATYRLNPAMAAFRDEVVEAIKLAKGRHGSQTKNEDVS